MISLGSTRAQVEINFPVGYGKDSITNEDKTRAWNKVMNYGITALSCIFLSETAGIRQIAIQRPEDLRSMI
jgi:hypothetical protein